MFDDLFNENCMICGSVVDDNNCICGYCICSILQFTVTQNEIVDELTEYYKIYGYDKSEDKNNLIFKLSMKIKVRKYIKKRSLQ
jgi:hypothetical protein